MITRREDMKLEVRERMRGGNGAAQLTGLSAALPGKLRLFSTIRLTPGSSIGYHVHEGETELFYFLTGSGRVQDDDERVDVAAGDSMATFSGHGHAVENTGSEDLVFVAAIVLD